MGPLGRGHLRDDSLKRSLPPEGEREAKRLRLDSPANNGNTALPHQLIEDWFNAAKNNSNTSLRQELFSKTNDAAQKLKELRAYAKQGKTAQEVGQVCLQILKTINAHSIEELNFLGTWIASNSSPLPDNLLCDAFQVFDSYLNAFRSLIDLPEVYPEVQENALSYTLITERARRAMSAVDIKCDIFRIDDIHNLVALNLDSWSISSLSLISKNHRVNVKSILMSNLNNGRMNRYFSLEYIINLLGKQCNEVKKLSIRNLVTELEIPKIRLHFPNLEELSMAAETIKGLSSLKKLSKLESLDLSKSRVQSLSFLSELLIKTLCLGDCNSIMKFEAIDSSKLKKLVIINSSIKHLHFLNSSCRIEELVLSNLCWPDFSSQYPQCPSVKSLDLSCNKRAIPASFLAKFPNLNYLNLENCNDIPSEPLKHIKYGKCIYPDGSSYEGTFENSLLQGKGKASFPTVFPAQMDLD